MVRGVIRRRDSYTRMLKMYLPASAQLLNCTLSSLCLSLTIGCARNKTTNYYAVDCKHGTVVTLAYMSILAVFKIISVAFWSCSIQQLSSEESRGPYSYRHINIDGTCRDTCTKQIRVKKAIPITWLTKPWYFADCRSWHSGNILSPICILFRLNLHN